MDNLKKTTTTLILVPCDMFDHDQSSGSIFRFQTCINYRKLFYQL